MKRDEADLATGTGPADVPANNGNQTSERVERAKNCALAYYGIDPVSATGWWPTQRDFRCVGLSSFA